MPVSTLGKALLNGKCPHCRKGDIFKFSLKHTAKFAEMNSNCSNCGVSFEPEPGFYYGAMFVSYGFNVMLLIAIWLFIYVLFDPSDWVYMVAIPLGAVLFTPLFFRYSRILFLHMFGGLNFDPTIK
jgi:uncharacterized protein (DUF983 family)